MENLKYLVALLLIAIAVITLVKLARSTGGATACTTGSGLINFIDSFKRARDCFLIYESHEDLEKCIAMFKSIRHIPEKLMSVFELLKGDLEELLLTEELLINNKKATPGMRIDWSRSKVHLNFIASERIEFIEGRIRMIDRSSL